MKYITEAKLRQGMDFLKELDIKEIDGVNELQPGYLRKVHRRRWNK